VSGVEEQLGRQGRLACAQLLLQRGMYVRCTNTYHLPTRKNRGTNKKSTVDVISSMSGAKILLPMPLTEDWENDVAIIWVAARCALMARISVLWMAIWAGCSENYTV
jgi:hypothetical protein